MPEASVYRDSLEVLVIPADVDGLAEGHGLAVAGDSECPPHTHTHCADSSGPGDY